MLEHRPQLADASPRAAREWFAAIIAQIGGGWHPDDHPSTIMSVSDGRWVFSPDDVPYVSVVIKEIRNASRSWPDPDLLYTIAAQAAFDAETLWPGFVVDMSVPGCLGTGYVSAPLENPNFLIEDGGEVFAVEFPGETRPMSRYDEILVTPLDGAVFAGECFHVAGATPDLTRSVTVSSPSKVGDAVSEILAARAEFC